MIDHFLSAGSRLIFWIVVLALSFITMMFIMQNNHDISLYFDFLKSNALHIPIVTLPVWGFAFILFLSGAGVGASILWYYISQLRDVLAQEQKSAEKLKGDMDALKSTISKTVS